MGERELKKSAPTHSYLLIEYAVKYQEGNGLTPPFHA